MNLMNLPTELIDNIIKNLEWTDAISFSATCKKAHSIVSSSGICGIGPKSWSDIAIPLNALIYPNNDFIKTQIKSIIKGFGAVIVKLDKNSTELIDSTINLTPRATRKEVVSKLKQNGGDSVDKTSYYSLHQTVGAGLLSNGVFLNKYKNPIDDARNNSAKIAYDKNKNQYAVNPEIYEQSSYPYYGSTKCEKLISKASDDLLSNIGRSTLDLFISDSVLDVRKCFTEKLKQHHMIWTTTNKKLKPQCVKMNSQLMVVPLWHHNKGQIISTPWTFGMKHRLVRPLDTVGYGYLAVYIRLVDSYFGYSDVIEPKSNMLAYIITSDNISELSTFSLLGFNNSPKLYIENTFPWVVKDFTLNYIKSLKTNSENPYFEDRKSALIITPFIPLINAIMFYTIYENIKLYRNKNIKRLRIKPDNSIPIAAKIINYI